MLKKQTASLNKLALAVAVTAGLANIAYAEAIQIKSQNLSEALKDLSKQSGAEIIFNPSRLKNISSQAIAGDFEVEEALSLLLINTNQTYIKDSNNVYTIQDAKSDDSEEGEKGEENEVDEEIVVTGSLLRGVRPNAQTIIIDMEEMKRRGLFTAEDVIRSLPQNTSTLNSASSRFNDTIGGFIPDDTQGNAAANLRGIGTQGTLVLIDGKRVAGSPIDQGGFINLNNIPLHTMERVEILLDGASAIYGADALAGVINFITRKDYTGATTTVRLQDSVNEGNEYQLTQDFAYGWETGNFNGSISRIEIKPTSTVKAGWVTSNHTARGGSDFRPIAEFQPGQVLNAATFQAIGSLPADFDGTENWTIDDLSEANGQVDTVPEHFGAKSRSSSLNFSIEQDVFDGFRARSSLLYSRNENAGTNLQPSIQFAPVPANNPFNRLNTDVRVSYFFVNEVASGRLRPAQTRTEQDSLVFSLGFDWDLPFLDGWQWEFTASQSKSGSKGTGDRIDGRFHDVVADALASTDPNTALNLFGNGTAQPEGLDLNSLYDTRFASNPDSYTRFVDSIFEGPVFKMPSDETVRLAVGFEYRESYVDYSGDLNRAINVPFAQPGVPRDIPDDAIIIPKQNIAAFFFNTSVPIVGADNSLPGVQTLDLILAGRYEKYNIDDTPTGGEFSNFSPKVGLSWNPVDSVRIFANWSESFIAPNFNDLLPRLLPVDQLIAESTFGALFRDPEFENVELPHPNYPFTAFPSFANFAQVPFGSQGDPNLKPEFSTNISYGFTWTPEFIPGFSLNVSYTEIDYQDRLANTVNFRDTTIKFSFPGVAFREEGTNALIAVIDRPVNVSRTLVETTDVSVSYDWDTDFGAFTASLSSAYTGKYEDTLVPGLEPFNNDGTNRGPDRLRHVGRLVWQDAQQGLSLTVNYSSGYGEFEGRDKLRDVQHYATHDITGWYDMPDHGIRISAGVRNVTNTKAPFEDNHQGFSLIRVDPRGRTFYLETRKTFDM